MTGGGMSGGAIGSEAIGAATLQQLASEWGGPRPTGAGARSEGVHAVTAPKRTVRPRR